MNCMNVLSGYQTPYNWFLLVYFHGCFAIYSILFIISLCSNNIIEHKLCTYHIVLLHCFMPNLWSLCLFIRNRKAVFFLILGHEIYYQSSPNKKKSALRSSSSSQSAQFLPSKIYRQTITDLSRPVTEIRCMSRALSK